MTAALGVSLLALAAIIFAWAYGQYRRPDPRTWTRSEVPTYAITLGTITLFTLGLGYTADAVINFETEPLNVIGGLLIAGALALAGLLVPRLVRPARVAAAAGTELASPAPESAVVLPHPGLAGGPDTTPRPSDTKGAGKKTRRRRAA